MYISDQIEADPRQEQVEVAPKPIVPHAYPARQLFVSGVDDCQDLFPRNCGCACCLHVSDKCTPLQLVSGELSGQRSSHSVRGLAYEQVEFPSKHGCDTLDDLDGCDGVGSSDSNGDDRDSAFVWVDSSFSGHCNEHEGDLDDSNSGMQSQHCSRRSSNPSLIDIERIDMAVVDLDSRCSLVDENGNGC